MTHLILKQIVRKNGHEKKNKDGKLNKAFIRYS